MSDETGESGDGTELTFEADQPPSAAEVYSWSAPNGSGGLWIFPSGVEAWALANDVGVLHIDSKTGAITVQHELGQALRPIDKGDRAGVVKSIKPA